MSVAISRFETQAAASAAARLPRLQRGDGVAEIGFARRGTETRLAHLYQRTPCRVLFPERELGDPTLAVLLTTSGGLTGGDKIRVALSVDENAATTFTSQAAEKLYRSLGPAADIDVALEAKSGAYLEYLPQETIVFDGAKLARRTRAMLAHGSRLFACDLLIFGRAAHDERLEHGSIYDRWQVWRDGALLWTDALSLDGDIAATLRSPFAFAGAEALGTAIYVGSDAATHLPFARKLAESSTGRSGVSFVRGVLLARFFGAPAAAMRADLARYLRAFRAAIGWPARLPRVWSV